MEQLFDLYKSTLASGYTPGSGTASVNSATGLPSSGSFSLTVLDQITLLVKVVWHVTSITGTTLTLTAEGSDNAANANDIVVGYMYTARSVPAILQDWLGYGPTANLPTTTGRKTGERFKVNDGAFEYYLDDGTENSPVTSRIWVPYYKGIKTAIPSQTFSWINQNGASITTKADGSLFLAGTASGSGNIQARVFTAPATPYKYKFVFTPILPSTQFAHTGILFSDGTKISELDGLYGNTKISITASHYNSATSFAGSLTAPAYILNPSGPLVFGLQDDGTNRTFFYYPDGYTEVQLNQEGRTTFLTATEVGFFYDDNSANVGGGIICHGIDRLI